MGVAGRLFRAPFTSGACVATLAAGFLAVMLAWGSVLYWRASDQHFAAADRIYLLTQSIAATRAGLNTGDTVLGSQPPGVLLPAEIPELDAVARFYSSAHPLSMGAGANQILVNEAIADPALLEIFDFTFVEGDAATALQSEDNVVITRSVAQRLFGDAPALGQAVRFYRHARDFEARRERIVSGVIEDAPQPSHFGSGADALARFDFLRPWSQSPRESGEFMPWTETRVLTYLLLPADGSLSLQALRHRLDAFVQRRAPVEVLEAFDFRLDVISLRDLSARRLELALFPQFAGRLPITMLLLGLGVLVLGTACFNFSNLLSARTTARMREFALRKALGASRGRIIMDVWLEAGALTAAALALAAAVMLAAAPAIRTRFGIDLLPALSGSPAFVALLLAAAAGAPLCSAAYPVMVATRARPASAMTGRSAPASARTLAMTLVAAQFFAASTLLIGVSIMRDQNALLRAAGARAGADPVAVLNYQGRANVDIDTLAQQLEAFAPVVRVSESGMLPWSANMQTAAYAASDDPGATGRSAEVTIVGYGFFDVFGMELLAGRVFDPGRDAGATEARIVIDRAYARALGFRTPQAALGARLTPRQSGGDAEAAPVEVIGVVENASMSFTTTAGGGTVFQLSPNSGFAYPVVRIAAADVDGGVAAIEEVWARLAPHMPLEIHFTEDLFDSSYRIYRRVSLTFNALCLAALLISALGLFAITARIARSRLREIGVRKTLGSTTERALRMVIWDFSKPVVVANLAAWPIVFVAAQAYLSTFVTRAPLTPAPFFQALAFTLLLAWLAVGGQSWWAARVKPAGVLRSE